MSAFSDDDTLWFGDEQSRMVLLWLITVAKFWLENLFGVSNQLVQISETKAVVWCESRAQNWSEIWIWSLYKQSKHRANHSSWTPADVPQWNHGQPGNNRRCSTAIYRLKQEQHPSPSTFCRAKTIPHPPEVTVHFCPLTTEYSITNPHSREKFHERDRKFYILMFLVNISNKSTKKCFDADEERPNKIKAGAV